MKTTMKRMAVLVGSLFFFVYAGMAPAAAPADKNPVENGQKAGQDWMSDMNMVLVKGGCFQMGDTFGDGESDEQPVHEVCVNDFAIGKFEVTQREWGAVMGSNPSSATGCDACPVESVRWNDVQEFLSRLNQQTGNSSGNNINRKARSKYRLPTEAEWEYAARSGGKSEKWAGTSSEPELGDYAWYSADADGRVHPVGQKRPNGLGIYDMTGNVWEWVEDVYSKSAYRSHDRNGGMSAAGDSGVSGHVYRGGGWGNEPGKIRAAGRNHTISNVSRHDDLGFRIVRTPDQ